MNNSPDVAEQPRKNYVLMNASRRHKETSKPSVKILFGVAVFVLLACVASSPISPNDDTTTIGTITSSSSHQWSMDNSDVVPQTETLLPGDIPLQNSHSSNGRQLRWGILGLGRIARDFTTALIMTGANITAVAAGSLPNAEQRARDFAQLYHVPQSYGTYEELAEDPNVDFVYIATINTLHYEPALMMLRGGKNVLIEKPMVMQFEHAEHLALEAKKAQRFLMANYWTRFFPVMKYVRSLILNSNGDGDGGRLGPITGMHGDLAFFYEPNNPDPDDRFLNRQSGGGAMLDLGCYLVMLAVMVHQSNGKGVTPEFPSQIEATAETDYLGVNYAVDTDIAYQLHWDGSSSNNNNNDKNNNNNNWTASLSPTPTPTTGMTMSGQGSFRRGSSREVEIDGLFGRVVIRGPVNAANVATIYEYEPLGGPLKLVEEVHAPLPAFDTRFGQGQYPDGSGFIYVIHEIEQCMLKYGIPGRDDHVGGGCQGLKELPLEEILLTVNITETVMKKAGYWATQQVNITTPDPRPVRDLSQSGLLANAALNQQHTREAMIGPGSF